METRLHKFSQIFFSLKRVSIARLLHNSIIMNVVKNIMGGKMPPFDSRRLQLYILKNT